MPTIQLFNFRYFFICIIALSSACSKNIEDCTQFKKATIPSLDNKVIAHSHNDYEQVCPLTKALSLGFTSIEVDIFPFKETIVVSHEDDILDIKPTIQSMYLNPLREIFSDNNNNNKINLLVDLKVYTDEFLSQLHTVMEDYDEILISRNSSDKNVKIILSGNLPREEIIQNENWIYFFIDGRLTDLGKDIDSHLMPMISAGFSDIFDFNPSQILSRDEIELLKSLTKLVHDENKLIRFWNTSDSDIIWSQLIEMGVDVIGVDNLDSFSDFIYNI